MSARTDALFRVLEDAARRGRLVLTGHDTPDVDSLIACALLRDLCAWRGIRARIVLPTRADAQSRRVLPRFGLSPDELTGETAAEDFLALVDHHQTPHPGTVVACIDHHPTQNPPQIPYVQIEPCGACALMVWRLMREAGMEPTRMQTEMTVTALYLDTLALRSPKIPGDEAGWAREQARLMRLDEAWLEREGLHLSDMSQSARELAMHGKKAYRFAGACVVSTHLQAEHVPEEKLEAMLTVLRGAVREEGAALWVFLVHEPLKDRSTEYDITPDGRMTRIAHKHLVSRGKDVMPRIERLFLSREAKKGV